jgi:hypothetical protein
MKIILSEKELKIIYHVCQNIGGSPHDSLRKNIDVINKNIRHNLVDLFVYKNIIKGTIYFNRSFGKI